MNKADLLTALQRSVQTTHPSEVLMQATKLADAQILTDLLEQVREEISLICDSEGDRIQPGEVESAIAHLLQTHLEDCRFQDEMREWLDRLRFGT